MLAKIAQFELRYQVRSPLFVIGVAIFFLMTFGSITIDQIQLGSRGIVNLNSPYAMLQVISIMNIFGLFVVTAFVANVVIRDDESGFAPILRATRIKKFDYLVGRFLGALLVAFIVMLMVPLAIWVGCQMPWVDQEKVGPFVFGHYLYAVFFFGLPTLLLIGATFFALATATRSMMWTYLGVIGFLILFIATRVILRDPTYDTISGLTDPFGLGALSRVTKYWTATERNTMMPAIEGVLLYNRLIWIGVAAAMFLIAYRIFRFESKGSRVSKAEATRDASADTVAPVSARAIGSRAPMTAIPRASAWSQLVALTRFDMAFVFKSPAFFVLLAMGIFNAVGGMTLIVEQRGVPYFPVTRAMIETLEEAFSIIPIIIAIYYAGELVWRDRERRIHEIVDATPAPDWAFVLPKVFAVVLVLTATLMVAVLASVLFQLYQGYTRFELGLYLLWFIAPGLITAALLGTLAVFAQAIVPHKFVGWALMLVYLVARITFATIGLEHNLYNFAGTPSVPSSDMNGLDRFWIGRAWFQVYWLAFAVMLLVLAHLLWRRGVDLRLGPRLRRLGSRFRGAPAMILLAASAVFVGTGVYNFWNTNVLNEYSTTPSREKYAADFEKAFLAYEKVPQPTIVEVSLDVDLYPKEVRATTKGVYTIENRTKLELPGLHVRWSSPLTMQTLVVDGASLEKDYADFRYRIYKFAQPMLPGEKRTIRFETLLQERGFPNSRPLTRIVSNGSFLNNSEISPTLGMDRDQLLQDRSTRRKYGLEPEHRVAKLEDPTADAHHYFRKDSDWVNAKITLTTDADQTPVAPGYKLSDTTKAGRRTLVTQTEAPIMHFFSLQSARYAVKSETMTGKDGKPIELSVYHHPSHEHNAQRMLDAMRESITLFSEKFSPYQFRQARILEFPGYESFAQAFANTMPYSESGGFLQNFEEKDADTKIDLVTFVTAHEVGHQWWAHQLIGADKQGMTLLSESFAEYSALLVMEKLYGKEQIRKFLKHELDRYLRARGGELIEELPLNRVENQGYIHYNKGALTMYWLKEAIGEEVVNRSLQKLLAQFAFKPAPYPSSRDFLRILREEAGPQHEPLITDLFEKITLYDMKASDAKASKRSDGKFDVSFTIDARKLYADGKGKETEAPLDEPFEVGAFTEEPGKKGYTRASVIHVERRPMQSGKTTVTLTLDKLPKFVGVDPFNKRIDRNGDDNLTRVSGGS